MRTKAKEVKFQLQDEIISIVAICMNGYLPVRNQGTLGNILVVRIEGSTNKFKLEKDDNDEINGQDNNSLE